MSDITVKFKDGTEEIFSDNGAPGGSYHNSIRYEGSFVIIQDAYGDETAFPTQDIDRVHKASERRGW